MKLLRLPRLQVRLGTALPWNVRDENCVLLLSKGHIVIDENHLQTLLERGVFVDEEEVKATAARQRDESKPVMGGGDPRKTLTSVDSVFGLWEKTSEDLKALLSHPLSEPDFPARMETYAQHIVTLFDMNPDYAIYRSVRQDNVQHFYYGYSHAVHTAVLCILMARHLAWPPATVMSLVKAALTMNMTIFELQGQMAAQEDKMKDRQRALVHPHPTEAVELLKKCGVTDADWLQAVAQHHERADGTGYPAGRTDITELAAALRVADVFMAKITPRVLHPALIPKDAIAQLYRDDKGGPLSTAVIKEFGIYPPGDFVKLASGELGLVVQRTANAKAPIVASITDTTGKPVAKTVRHDTGQAEFAIVERVEDKTLLKRLAPERLYGFSAAPPAA